MPIVRLKTALIACLYGAVLAVPGLFAFGGAARATPVNLVSNGDFSSTSLSGAGGFLCANTGGSSCTSQLGSWTSTCATYGCTGTSTPSSILFAGSNGSAWNGGFGLYWSGIGNAPLGGNAVAIDGDPTYSGALSQSISGLKIGDTYSLQFYQAASQQIGLSGATTEQWKVSLGGGTAQTSDLMSTPSQGAHAWMQETMTFVATSVTETLQFLALGTPQGEPPVVILGDVSLTDVPEPGVFATLAVGLLALFTIRRRRAA
jgi:hypothetical protein